MQHACSVEKERTDSSLSPLISPTPIPTAWPFCFSRFVVVAAIELPQRLEKTHEQNYQTQATEERALCTTSKIRSDRFQQEQTIKAYNGE
jgi:hypothetical protein